MSNICCATKALLRSNKTLSSFRVYTGSLSREDVATLVEVFEFALSEIPVESIIHVLRNSEGYFLFEYADGYDGAFDFYEYINKGFTGQATVSPVNAKLMFPRALSKGIYSRYSEYENPVEEEDDEPATGYMDAADLSGIHNVEYYLLYARTQEEVIFSETPLKIGRSAKTADFVTKVSLNVSRPHCSIYLQGGVPMIKDEKSANGTFVNGNKLTPLQGTSLEVGDTVVLADEEFVVKSR